MPRRMGFMKSRYQNLWGSETGVKEFGSETGVGAKESGNQGVWRPETGGQGD